ncbi:hypothetical protein GCM10027271_12670 [Saccharopolyspora gloriosae]
MRPGSPLLWRSVLRNHARRHTPRGARGGYPLRVELIPFLHYGLVSLLVIATIMVLWFAGYVLFRLYND